MSNSYEKLENSMVKIRMEIAPETFEAAIERAFNKQKNSISLPGFRKGKAPRHMIEKVYGKEIFYEDAINDILPGLYEEALKEIDVDILSRPEIDLDPIVSGQPIIVYATAATRPEVKLPKYKAMKVEKEEVTVTDEDVEAELKKIANKNARTVTVDRAAEDGDTVNIDYCGTVDGVAFEGGTADAQDLKLGSGTFIPGFEEQLVGAKAGDSVDVKVTFPTEYHAAELAGKDAVFACKVNAVKTEELPELNDDFAADYSEFETLAEYKEQLKKDITERKSKEKDDKRAKAILDKIIDKAEVAIPDAIIDTRADNMIEDMAQNLRYQGLSIEDYMKYMGTDLNGLRANIRPQALRNVQEELILDEIAKNEKMEVTEEDYEAELAEMGKMYNMDVEKIKELISEPEAKSIKDSLKNKKAVKYLLESVKA